MPSFTTRITVYPDISVQPDGSGGFQPDSFAELLQLEIRLPGLDPTYTHTLVDVAVAADRNSADLTVRSQAPAALSLDRSLRVVSGTPTAWVRVVDQAGTTLAEGSYPAPLRPSQRVAVGADQYLVQTVTWPGRDPQTGMCTGDVDWQVATVIPQPQPATIPVAAAVAT
jgi:hypothetical protein